MIALALAITTVLIIIFVPENESSEYIPNVKETYQQIGMVLMMKPG